MTDFWSWAVRAYAGQGVADRCLSLQDEDSQNVPLLLWALWLATQGYPVGRLAEAGAALARDWSDAAISPLRLIRRRLKTAVSAGDEALRLPLREKIKAAELAAEHLLMAQLEALAASTILPKSEKNHNINALARQNLLAVAAAWHEKVPVDRLFALVEALSGGQFLRYDG